MSRLRRAAWLSLALLCVCTLGAGVAAASLLPARLALWKVPRVAGRVLTAAPGESGLAAVSEPGGRAAAPAAAPAATRATPAGVAAALAGTLRSGALGAHYGALVTDLATGRVLFARSAGSSFAPASTTKLATAVAALDVLGPGARFATRVVSRSPGTVVLVGGGDPTLAAGRPPAADYPRPATLAALAARTTRALRARGRRTVALRYDTSLFTGPLMAPGWPGSYVSTGNVTPIQSLEVDQGRLTASGAPQDAQDPGNYRARTFTPAAAAASAFAGFLVKDGIRVRGAAAPVPPAGSGSAGSAGSAGSGSGAAGSAGSAARGSTLARVESPPLSAIVAWMLDVSNNVIAENLARQVAVATGHPASFAGAAAAERSVLAGLGVTSGVSLVDGSGLSPRDRITPAALVKLVTLAASAGHPGLRPVITGLPVAGFTGTLAPGGSVFGTRAAAALGLVRAKTGNLLTVAALAGLAYSRGGQLLAFAFMADRLPRAGLDRAGSGMAAMAAALAGCGCRRR